MSVVSFDDVFDVWGCVGAALIFRFSVRIDNLASIAANLESITACMAANFISMTDLVEPTVPCNSDISA